MLSARFWQRWEGRLYHWYYRVLPWPSPAHKRRLILLIHRYCSWLSQHTASYQMLPYLHHSNLHDFETKTTRYRVHNYSDWRAKYLPPSKREHRRLKHITKQLNAIQIGILITPSHTAEAAATQASLSPLPFSAPQLLFINSHAAVLDQSVDYLMVIRAGVRLNRLTFLVITEAIKQWPEAKLFYADEEWSDGEHYQPWFKPDWDPELMLSCNLVGAIAVYHRDALVDCDWNPDHPAWIYALALRASERLLTRQIVHIPRILACCQPESLTLTERMRIIDQTISRRGQHATLEASPLVSELVRIRYALPTPAPKISLIIPTRNQRALLNRCLDTLITKTHYPDYEVLVIDNGSNEADALTFLASLAQRYPDVNLRVIRDDRPFNYSQLNNEAVKQARGELIGLLNNDLEVLDGDWLNEMASHACRSEIGAVGARLLYPDGCLQHAGVIVGLGGAAGHVLRHQPCEKPDRFGPPGIGRSRLVQYFSVVTAACLVVRKKLYQEVNGLDEVAFPVTYNDVDFCLKLRQLGYRNLYTPFATLYHHESASRGSDDEDPIKATRATKELANLQQRWSTWNYRDPAYNPNFSLFGEDCSYSYPPRI